MNTELLELANEFMSRAEGITFDAAWTAAKRWAGLSLGNENGGNPFDESEHPRADNGKFTASGSSGKDRSWATRDRNGVVNYQQNKHDHEAEVLERFEKSDNKATVEEVEAAVNAYQMRGLLQRGFEATFGGQSVVFCLENLDEKYGDEKSSKYDLARLAFLKECVHRRKTFINKSHSNNQRALIMQGKPLADGKRYVIVCSKHGKHGKKLVAVSVQKADRRTLRKEYGYGQ